MHSLWRRDVEVIELVKYFDRPEKRGRWETITTEEARIILREIENCRKDFRYASRNYFTIIDKKGDDIPFFLWESQELVLEKWYWLREKFPDRAQRLMILKARQLGASTVIEALIAWKTIFFCNVEAMVVSNTDTHASYLFNKMLHIYDHLPWWLQPMIASRKQDEGLFFANPKYDERSQKPGNMSRVTVQSAKQTSGVGQGMTLSAVHLSEFADWEWDKFHEIINGDMIHALADNLNSFAFLESTGKGAGSPSEEMWTAQVELAEEAKWVPIFLPWFFEKTRFLSPENGWRPQQPEQDMREKISRDWVRCGNLRCEQYFEAIFRKVSRVNQLCPECQAGELIPVQIADAQLRFMQRERVNAEKEGLEAVKKLREELSSNAEEAFQLTGIQVFPPSCHDFVNYCTDPNPLIWGDIDNKGNIHWVADSATGKCGCPGCAQDHRWDLEHPLQVWELPLPNAKYSVGVDVAEGLQGKADFSVIFVNKVSPNGRYPDEQVAQWRSNSVDPIQLASPINAIGRLYNEALVSIEVNKYDSCFNNIRMQYLYPNLFTWKHYDSKNPISNKLGWVTNVRSKPMLWQTAVRWLKSRMWIVRSPEFAFEMKRFQKDDYEDQRASAERNYHDDVLIAGMISLFCVAPETRVLKTDLRWVPIGECREGDKLLAFDEDIGSDSPCLLRESEITYHKVIQEPRFEIVTDKGTVVASGHHGWAVHKFEHHSASSRRWLTTEGLNPGDRIIQLSRPWETDNTADGQWLAGFLDGEGCVRLNHKGLQKFGRNVGRGSVSFSQNQGVALEKALMVCDRLGIRTKVGGNGKADKKCRVVNLSVPAPHSALEIIGRIRPVRLLENSRSLWDCRPFLGWHWPTYTATVLEVRPLGVGPVVSIGTTTKTFFAEGLASHNCAHDMDYSDDMDFIPVKSQDRVVTAEFLNTCMSPRCAKQWETGDYPANRCPHCGSMLINSHRQSGGEEGPIVDFNDLVYTAPEEP